MTKTAPFSDYNYVTQKKHGLNTKRKSMLLGMFWAMGMGLTIYIYRLHSHHKTTDSVILAHLACIGFVKGNDRTRHYKFMLCTRFKIIFREMLKFCRLFGCSLFFWQAILSIVSATCLWAKWVGLVLSIQMFWAFEPT
jgi:hypothetical protein